MVDPKFITNFTLTIPQLEERLVWWILAAGKDGLWEARCTEEILIELQGHNAPFSALAQHDHTSLTALLARHKTGAQSLKARTILAVAKSGIDLTTCTRENLLDFWGIGMKTASCFILHSRPRQDMIGIDTHFLKFLADQGVPVPKQRPNKLVGRMHPGYLDLERRGIAIAKRCGLPCATLDLLVWNTYRVGNRLRVYDTHIALVEKADGHEACEFQAGAV
jgi:hypothetical protein